MGFYQWVAAIVGCTVNLVAAAFYIRSIGPEKIRPNIATWLIWTFLPPISAAATVYHGRGFNLGVITTLFFGLIPLAVVVRMLWVSGASVSPSARDKVCFVLALIATALLAFPTNPRTIILLTIAADFLAALPTFDSGWRNPEREWGWNFLAAAFNGMAGIVAANSLAFADIGFNAYIAIAMGTLGTMVLLRTRWLCKG